MLGNRGRAAGHGGSGYRDLTPDYSGDEIEEFEAGWDKDLSSKEVEASDVKSSDPECYADRRAATAKCQHRHPTHVDPRCTIHPQANCGQMISHISPPHQSPATTVLTSSAWSRPIAQKLEPALVLTLSLLSVNRA